MLTLPTSLGIVPVPTRCNPLLCGLSMTTFMVEILIPPVPADNGAADPSDPFRYGWRPVQSELDDGQIIVE